MRILCILVALALALPACSKKSKAKSPVDSQREQANAESDEDHADDSPTEAAAVEATEPEPGLRTTYFEFDLATLSDTGRSKLQEASRWLKRHPGERILIEGHTCEIGTTEYNVALGERRAQSARDYLRRLGVDESRLNILSYGEEQPAVPGNLEKNRRAELEPRNGAGS